MALAHTLQYWQKLTELVAVHSGIGLSAQETCGAALGFVGGVFLPTVWKQPFRLELVFEA